MGAIKGDTRSLDSGLFWDNEKEKNYWVIVDYIGVI